MVLRYTRRMSDSLCVQTLKYVDRGLPLCLYSSNRVVMVGHVLTVGAFPKRYTKRSNLQIRRIYMGPTAECEIYPIQAMVVVDVSECEPSTLNAQQAPCEY